jgi:hypothetical protein
MVEECLGRWTPEMLRDEFRRERDGKIQLHSRQSVLIRLLTHDAYHAGEIFIRSECMDLPRSTSGLAAIGPLLRTTHANADRCSLALGRSRHA